MRNELILKTRKRRSKKKIKEKLIWEGRIEDTDTSADKLHRNTTYN